MEIGTKVIHKYNKLKTGEVVNLGTGSFTGQIKVCWNDGNTYHHAPSTLVQDSAAAEIPNSTAKTGSEDRVIDPEETTVKQDATDVEDGAAPVETADECRT